jgi:hypothetical protein
MPLEIPPLKRAVSSCLIQMEYTQKKWNIISCLNHVLPRIEMSVRLFGRPHAAGTRRHIMLTYGERKNHSKINKTCENGRRGTGRIFSSFFLSLFLSTRTALLSLCQKSLGHTQELLGQHTHTAAILAAFYNTHKGPSESKAKPLHHKTVRY